MRGVRGRELALELAAFRSRGRRRAHDQKLGRRRGRAKLCPAVPRRERGGLLGEPAQQLLDSSQVRLDLRRDDLALAIDRIEDYQRLGAVEAGSGIGGDQPFNGVIDNFAISGIGGLGFSVATDVDYFNIDRVVAHEYFHNWTGNRVTCRDWFQLSLKEGLTVFRDQEYGADTYSRAVTRIQEVRSLRASQFPEDAGPMAHPSAAARPRRPTSRPTRRAT